jgi:hypothetical protein
MLEQYQEIQKWKVLNTLIPTKSSEKSIPNDFSPIEINASDFNQHFINTLIELTRNIEPTEESLKVDLLTDKTFSLPLIDRIKYNSFIFIFKSLNKLSSHFSHDFLKFVSHSRRTRSVTDQKLFIPNVRLTAFKNSIFATDVQFYNDLSIDFKNCKKLTAFRNVLKNYFINGL